MHGMRDDLFTLIHKAIRKALFDVTVLAGTTDWSSPADVAAFDSTWQPVLGLLRAHTEHEDRHILRVLDPYETVVTDAVDERHRDLDDLLEHLAAEVDATVASLSPAGGLDVYRDLARFVAAYLPHLHDEETAVMPRIWARCSDDEIAATRAAFMADMTPDVLETSMTYLLQAIDPSSRELLLARTAS